tara:strand:+ start:11460 stop:11897 length:438 start_codon:yes stop_codon:yes gene_type:complete
MKLEEFLNGKNAETYFDEKLKECEYISELPRELNNCTCCKRHKINFPILGQKIVSKEYTTNYPNSDCKCKCPCRHIARHICREWELIHEVEDIDVSTEDSEESDEEDSAGSLEDFIVPDSGFKRKERKALDKALNKFRGKKTIRR